MNFVYHGLIINSARENVDASAGEALFLSLTIANATTLINKIVSNQG